MKTDLNFKLKVAKNVQRMSAAEDIVCKLTHSNLKTSIKRWV